MKWLEEQISAAKRRGDFDNLPGAGQPLAPDATGGMDVWLKKKLAEEGLEAPLPPGLELRRETPRALAAIARLTDERRVRTALAELNARIRHTNATLMAGPSSNLLPIDVEDFVARWRLRR